MFSVLKTTLSLELFFIHMEKVVLLLQFGIQSVFVSLPHQQRACFISFCGIGASHFPALGFSQVPVPECTVQGRGVFTQL